METMYYLKAFLFISVFANVMLFLVLRNYAGILKAIHEIVDSPVINGRDKTEFIYQLSKREG